MIMIRIWRRLATLGYIVLLRNDLIAKRKSGNALGWDVGLLGQRSYSNTKRRMSIVLQFLRAIYQ